MCSGVLRDIGAESELHFWGKACVLSVFLVVLCFLLVFFFFSLNRLCWLKCTLVSPDTDLCWETKGCHCEGVVLGSISYLAGFISFHPQHASFVSELFLILLGWTADLSEGPVVVFSVQCSACLFIWFLSMLKQLCLQLCKLQFSSFPCLYVHVMVQFQNVTVLS